MKKLVVFAVLAAIVASCADDNPPQIEKSSELVSPRLFDGRVHRKRTKPADQHTDHHALQGGHLYLLWKLHKPEADTFLRLLPS